MHFTKRAGIAGALLCALLVPGYFGFRAVDRSSLNHRYLLSVANGNLADVQRQLDNGADINARDRFGTSAVWNAAHLLQWDVVKTLVSRGVDVNVVGDHGATLLMYAATHSDSDMIKSLIARGVPIEAKDDKGGTALLWAVGSAKPANVKALLEAGADINARDNQNTTALLRAKTLSVSKYPAYVSDRANYIEIIALLQRHGG